MKWGYLVVLGFIAVLLLFIAVKFYINNCHFAVYDLTPYATDSEWIRYKYNKEECVGHIAENKSESLKVALVSLSIGNREFSLIT